MKCPYCNEEMNKGFIPTESHTFWLPEGEKTPSNRLIVPKSAVRLVLDESSKAWKKAIAFYCSKCNIIISTTER